MSVTYPLVSDYKNAIIDSDSFATLNTLEPCYTGKDVYFATGGPAVVFKMYDTQRKKHIAIKCFIKELTTRQNSFQSISRYLSSLRENHYFVSYQYHDKEIWVNNDEYPVLCMPWIDGKTLGVRIAELCANKDNTTIQELANKFDKMALWLLNQELAHGDLKPDNIIVTPNNELMLVDYDGMFVPSLAGNKSPELGTAEYRHPKRTGADFNRYLDDFPIFVLSLSLHALAVNPSLYSKGQGGDALLFKSEDYKNLLTCSHFAFFQATAENDIIFSRFSMLMNAVMLPVLELVGLKDLLEKTASQVTLYKDAYDIPEYFSKIWSEYDKWNENNYDSFNEDEFICSSYDSNEIYNTFSKNKIIFTHQDKYGHWYDNQGLMYNDNKDCVLQIPNDVDNITFATSVIEISSNHAFYKCNTLKYIQIPYSVKAIGGSSFEKCSSLVEVDMQNSVTNLGCGAFMDCVSLKKITLSNKITEIKNRTFENCSSLHELNLHKNIKHIESDAFSGCSSLIRINANNNPNFVFEDGILYTFDKNRIIIALQKIMNSSVLIPYSVCVINKKSFMNCIKITHIYIDNPNIFIEDGAFEGCSAISPSCKNELIKKFGSRIFYA